MSNKIRTKRRKKKSRLFSICDCIIFLKMCINSSNKGDFYHDHSQTFLSLKIVTSELLKEMRKGQRTSMQDLCFYNHADMHTDTPLILTHPLGFGIIRLKIQSL